LLAARPDQLAERAGLGPAKSAQLQAVLELARRSLREEVQRDTVLSSPGKVCGYLRMTLGGREHEVFMALFLDAQNRLLVADELFRGTLTQTSVYPREVVKRLSQSTPVPSSSRTTIRRALPNPAAATNC
jgi:DNA repair protein RadC